MPVEIDPEILAARATMAAATGAFDIMTLPTAEGRALVDKAAMALNDGLPDMAAIEDHDAGGVRVRIYTPRTLRTDSWLYYLHGGGWFACSVDTHDRMLRMLAELTGARVVGADYRLSPEHPYPAPLDDCERGLDWALGLGMGDRFAFCGDSAGANLTLALAIRLRDAGRSLPAGLALLYGCFAPGLETLSARAFGGGAYGLTDARMQWYWANYLAGSSALEAMPLHADLSGLPPAFLGVAEADTVADDSRLLHARLDRADLMVWRGAVHGFLQMGRDVSLAREAIADVAHAIDAWLA